MTRQARLPSQAPARPRMRPACHELTWLGAANLEACDRETMAVGRAPPVSNAAMAMKTPSGALGLLRQSPATHQSRLKIP
jgi:hypothetical protein